MGSVFLDRSERLDRPLLWLDFERYAATVFAGQPADWTTNAHRHADTLCQAQRLVRSDVVAMPVLDPWLADAAWRSLAVGSLEQAVSQWAEPGSRQRFVAEVLDALFHRLGEQALMVLALPSPSRVLRAAGREPPFDFDALDDLGSALTAVLRSHCERRFAAVLLQCDEEEGLSDDEGEACGPLLKSARYYGWGTALRLDGVPQTQPLAPIDGFDAVLLGHWGASALAATGLGHVAGGLDACFAEPAPAPLSRRAMHFGTIAADALPERVAQRLALLHGSTG